MDIRERSMHTAAGIQGADSYITDYLQKLSERTAFIVSDRIAGRRDLTTDVFIPLELGTQNIFEDGDLSNKRNLIIAGAGSGKTTLLKRLAYIYALRCLNTAGIMDPAYADSLTTDHDHVRSDEELISEYSLPDQGFPILLKLRDMKEYGYSICQAAEDQAGGVPSDALLFLDGLDELPEEKRDVFLAELEKICEEKPDIYVYMTTRISGKSGTETAQYLENLKFKEVTLNPLTDEQMIKYVQKRLYAADINDPEKNTEKMQRIIKKLKGYGGLLCRPLELDAIIDTADSPDTDAVTDRYSLFEKMLFQLLTSRDSLTDKEAVFSDGMTILGTVSFLTQCRETVYINSEIIKEADKILGNESFAVFNNSNGIGDFLEKLSKSTGIIEKTGESVYSFPARSYQEFLCAFYCINDGYDRPDLFRIVCGNINNSFWLETIIFIMQGIKETDAPEFDRMIRYVFSNMEDEESLKQVVESVPVTCDGQAKVLCERLFNESSFRDGEIMFAYLGTDTGNLWQKVISENILFSCLSSENGHIWRRVIDHLYRERMKEEVIFGNFRDMFKPFLRATAFCKIMEGDRLPEADTIGDLLDSEDRCDNLLGACILSELAYIGFGEKLENRKDEAKAVICSFSNVKRLDQIAHENLDYVCIKALSDIWLSDTEAGKEAEKALDDKLVKHLIEMMNNSEDELVELWDFGINGTDFMNGLRSSHLASAIGCMPVSKRYTREYITNLSTTVFIKGQFLFLRDLWEIDMVGTAAANAYCIRDRKMFSDLWETSVKDIVEQGECGEREQNLYRLQTKRLEEAGYF